MVNFGTICSWKIRSLDINRVGGGGNFTTCKIYGRINFKKSLDEVWGGAVWKSSKLSQNGRNQPPPLLLQVINDVLYINCNILSFTVPIFENRSTKEWFLLKSTYLLHIIPHILVIRTEKHTGRLKQDLWIQIKYGVIIDRLKGGERARSPFGTA